MTRTGLLNLQCGRVVTCLPLCLIRSHIHRDSLNPSVADSPKRLRMQGTRKLINDFMEPLLKVDFNGISKNLKYYFTLSNVFLICCTKFRALEKPIRRENQSNITAEVSKPESSENATKYKSKVSRNQDLIGSRNSLIPQKRNIAESDKGKKSLASYSANKDDHHSIEESEVNRRSTGGDEAFNNDIPDELENVLVYDEGDISGGVLEKPGKLNLPERTN